jgi:hypothetical protein
LFGDRSVLDDREVRVRLPTGRCSITTKPMFVGDRSGFGPREAPRSSATERCSITMKSLFVGVETKVRRERNGSRRSSKPRSSRIPNVVVDLARGLHGHRTWQRWVSKRPLSASNTVPSPAKLDPSPNEPGLIGVRPRFVRGEPELPRLAMPRVAR